MCLISLSIYIRAVHSKYKRLYLYISCVSISATHLGPQLGYVVATFPNNWSRSLKINMHSLKLTVNSGNQNSILRNLSHYIAYKFQPLLLIIWRLRRQQTDLQYICIIWSYYVCVHYSICISFMYFSILIGITCWIHWQLMKECCYEQTFIYLPPF
jgi:hypothetical protein